MSSAAPVRKVAVGAAAGALTTVLVWVVSLTGLEVPDVVAAAVTTLVIFAASYLTPAASSGDHAAS